MCVTRRKICHYSRYIATLKKRFLIHVDFKTCFRWSNLHLRKKQLCLYTDVLSGACDGTACTLSHFISPVRLKSQTNLNKQVVLWRSCQVLSNTVSACCFQARLRLGLFGACRLPSHTRGNCTTMPNKSQMAFEPKWRVETEKAPWRWLASDCYVSKITPFQTVISSPKTFNGTN